MADEKVQRELKEKLARTISIIDYKERQCLDKMKEQKAKLLISVPEKKSKKLYSKKTTKTEESEKTIQ